MAPMNQSQLSAPVLINTDVPYPVIDFEASKATNILVLKQDPNEKILVEIASELVNVSVPTSFFSSKKGENSPLDIVHDAVGQPVIFSIDSEDHLCSILHVNKATSPWKLLDITPSIPNIASAKVSAFDVLELNQNLHFAVSLKFMSEGSSTETHQVFWASIQLKEAILGANGNIEGFTLSDLKWQAIENNLGSRIITKLVCTPDANPRPANADVASPPFKIFAATQTTATHLASTYVVDPNPSAKIPWVIITFGAQSYSIVDMQPVVLGGANPQSLKRAGLALLHDAPGREDTPTRRCNLLSLNDAGDEAFVGYSIDISKIGKLSSIYSSFNTWRTHDLLLVGNGIAFHRFQDLEHPCLDGEGHVILPHIPFRQAVCKETVLSNPSKVILSILAVSQDDQLYVIDGERDMKNFGIPTFKYSGMPIRGNVSQIACHYNRQLSSMEYIYTSRKANQICHLSRDSQTSAWISSDLKVPGPVTASKEQQYITTITLSNSTGQPVPEGYPVYLTSEPVFAEINELSYRLNRTRPTLVTTNDKGQVGIATAAPDQLGMSSLQVELKKFADKPYTFSMNPAARVMNMMSSINTVDDLKSMKSPKGESLFPRVPDDQLEAAAQLLSHFDTIRKEAEKVQSDSGDASDSASVTSDTTLVAWNGSVAAAGGSKASADLNWFEKAFEVAIEFVGDALEFMKYIVKSTVKFAVKVAAKGLHFVLQIGSKVISFVVKHTVTLVRSVVGFLDNMLGTNMIDLFSLNFGKHIPKIQQRLKDVTLRSLTILERFLVVNRSSLLDLFNDMELTLFGSVDKAKDPDVPRKESRLERIIKSIMNNPIIKLILKFNPLQWIMEGIVEGLAESISDFIVPDARPILKALGMTAMSLIKLGIDAFLEIFNIISNCATDVMTDPKKLLPIIMAAIKKSFRALFAATRDAALIVFDCFISMIKAIGPMLTTAWSIPGMTDMWADWTDQEFSLLNFVTYGGAIVINLMMNGIGMTDQQKSDVFLAPLPRDWTEIEITPLYKSFQEKVDQEALEKVYPGPSLPEHTRPIVMMVKLDGRNEKDETSPEKDAAKDVQIEADLKAWHTVEQLMTMIGGVSRTSTCAVEVCEAWHTIVPPAAQGQEGVELQPAVADQAGAANVPLNDQVGSAHINKPLQTVKVVAGIVTMSTSVVQLIAITVISKLSDSSKHPDPKLQASGLQLALMSVGTIVGGLGVVCDAIGGFSPVVTEFDAAQKKGFLAVAGVSFNLGSSLNAGFTPGTWTKPRGEEIAHVFGGIGGATAVVAAHTAKNTPYGPWIVGIGLGTDVIACGVATIISISHLSSINAKEH